MSRRIFRSVTAVLGAANIIILACKCYAGTPADWPIWLWAFLGAAGFTLDQIERATKPDGRLPSGRAGGADAPQPAPRSSPDGRSSLTQEGEA